MSKKDAALKLALEKVQEFKARWWKVPPFGNKVNKATREAITNAHSPIFELEHVIREALAEQPAQQQEPVVWMYVNKSTHETKFQKHMRDFVDHSLWSEVPLYGEPLANHELQCVCGAVWLGDEMVHLPDKRPSASKPWVGLTDEERKRAIQFNNAHEALAVVIEAKLKEKNA